MVKSLLSKLLKPCSSQRGPPNGYAWNRYDPLVQRSRDRDFFDVGPVYLVTKHPTCTFDDEAVDRLGEMIHNADYKCVRDGVSNHESHVMGLAQHKFDGIFVVFGAHQGILWERFVCFALVCLSVRHSAQVWQMGLVPGIRQ